MSTQNAAKIPPLHLRGNFLHMLNICVPRTAFLLPFDVNYVEVERSRL